LFDLITIEISVIRQGGKDRDVASGQASNEFGDYLLGEALAGVGGEFANKEWTIEFIGSPSRCRKPPFGDQLGGRLLMRTAEANR
jgi:hypothetical protein